MASLNKAILIGNLGRDPEGKAMPNGDPVTTFSIATSESWKDKNTGQKVEKTEWHNVVMYRRLAEIAAQYLRKGSSVYIEGRIQTRKYQAKDGAEKYITEIIADEMKMLGSKGGEGGAVESTPPAQTIQANSTAEDYQRAREGQKPLAPASNFVEDDIPF